MKKPSMSESRTEKKGFSLGQTGNSNPNKKGSSSNRMSYPDKPRGSFSGKPPADYKPSGFHPPTAADAAKAKC